MAGAQEKPLDQHTRAYQQSLTNAQRDFSEVMFFECRLCSSRLIEWESAIDVHFEWAGLDQLIQPVDSFAATFAVVCFAAYSCGRFRHRHDTVWISNAAARP